MRQVAREIQLHAELSHPGIIGFYAAFETLDAIYLVQEVRALPMRLLYHCIPGGSGESLGLHERKGRIMPTLNLQWGKAMLGERCIRHIPLHSLQSRLREICSPLQQRGIPGSTYCQPRASEQ